jgi:hypothetical protein
MKVERLRVRADAKARWTVAIDSHSAGQKQVGRRALTVRASDAAAARRLALSRHYAALSLPTDGRSLSRGLSYCRIACAPA